MSTYFFIATASVFFSVAYLAWRLYSVFRRAGGAMKDATEGPGGATDEEKKLLKLIRGVPKGRLVTFGALAKGMGGAIPPAQVARMVHTLVDKNHLPWWRVVRKEGRRAVLPSTDMGERQRKKLKSEGVEFEEGSIPLREYEWEL